MRYSIMNNSVVLYDMSTDLKQLKQRAKELSSKPSYKHPCEGYLFRYYFTYKNIKELELK